ncbi:hypothetical protein F5880DRAFT_1509953 [Lentinula raphanica]|nr:hypothetical protein F5880DRAFT_1509953 [Lentinula raphanica]
MALLTIPRVCLSKLGLLLVFVVAILDVAITLPMKSSPSHPVLPPSRPVPPPPRSRPEPPPSPTHPDPSPTPEEFESGFPLSHLDNKGLPTGLSYVEFGGDDVHFYDRVYYRSRKLTDKEAHDLMSGVRIQHTQSPILQYKGEWFKVINPTLNSNRIYNVAEWTLVGYIQLPDQYVANSLFKMGGRIDLKLGGLIDRYLSPTNKNFVKSLLLGLNTDNYFRDYGRLFNFENGKDYLMLSISAYTSPVLELLAAEPGEKIIDFGCGSGEGSVMIERHGPALKKPGPKDYPKRSFATSKTLPSHLQIRRRVGTWRSRRNTRIRAVPILVHFLKYRRVQEGQSPSGASLSFLTPEKPEAILV